MNEEEAALQERRSGTQEDGSLGQLWGPRRSGSLSLLSRRLGGTL